MQIAIDGPVAAGKGTVSKLVATRLGFLYVDTGAMFQAISLLCHQQGIDVSREPLVCQLFNRLSPDVSLRMPAAEESDGRLCTVFLNGEDVSWAIRTDEHSRGASTVGRYLCVRDYLVVLERRLAAQQNVVMEGRDIGTFVLPNAELKIFLTASEEERARRRHQELLSRGDDLMLSTVLTQIHERDHQDFNRSLRPLAQAPDTVVVDTTSLSIEEVVERVVEMAEARMRLQ